MSTQNETWYNAKSSDQGLVIAEGTGRTVAVTYDPKDAPLVAAAPDLLAALQSIAEHEIVGPLDEWAEAAAYSAVKSIARAALSKAKSTA